MNKMRLLLLLSALFLTAAAFAQPVPTYAWRRVLNLYNYNDTAGNFVTDLSGNGIFQYAENGGSHINHTVKMSPANNLIFDAQTTFGDTYRATGIAISPMVSGKQYAWGTGIVNGHGFGGNNPAYYVCYDITNASTAAVPIVQGTYPGSPYGDYNVVGVYVNSLGNLMMVIN